PIPIRIVAPLPEGETDMANLSRSLGLVLLVSLAATASAQTGRAPKSNRFGAPVVGADGTPISYTSAELRRQEAGAILPVQPAGSVEGGREALSSGGNPIWSYSVMGSGIGLSGIALSEGLPEPEIYAGGSFSVFGADDFWHALRYDAATHG